MKNNVKIEQNQPIVGVMPPEAPKIVPEAPKKIEPEFIEALPIRSVSGLRGLMKDVEEHLPKGHIYDDVDKITTVHECLHGINSLIRNKHQREPRINAFYCFSDKAALIEEPKTTIRDVAQNVPKSLRGNVFDLYLIQQQSGWNSEPMYLCDEWIGYTGGSAYRKEAQIQERSETVQFMLEFNVYTITLAKTIKEKDPSYNDKQFKAFLQWNLARTMSIYNNEQGATEYWRKIQINEDAKELREFAKSYFGEEWCKNVLKI